MLCTACPEYRLLREGPDQPPGGLTPEQVRPPGAAGPIREWCNGLDDDGDGDIDEGFTDADGDGLADCIDDACELVLPNPRQESCGPCVGSPQPIDSPPADPWSSVVEWSWSEGNPRMAEGSVMATPAIGDLDGDGIAEVVFVAMTDSTGASDTLVVVDGSSGVTRWESDGFEGGQAVAMGDIDDDGWGDIVAYALTEQGAVYLCALDRYGQTIWVVEHDIFVHTGDLANPHIADLDGDGRAEVLAHSLIIDGPTGTLEAELQGAEVGRATTWSPISADLDGDGVQEVLCHNGVYDHLGDPFGNAGMVLVHRRFRKPQTWTETRSARSSRPPMASSRSARKTAPCSGSSSEGTIQGLRRSVTSTTTGCRSSPLSSTAR